MDIQKGLEMLDKRRQTNRRYYMRKHGIVEKTAEEKMMQVVERAKKKLEAYERQKQRQKQQRVERGPLPKGRPYKSKENEEHNKVLMEQLKELEKIEDKKLEELD